MTWKSRERSVAEGPKAGPWPLSCLKGLLSLQRESKAGKAFPAFDFVRIANTMHTTRGGEEPPSYPAVAQLSRPGTCD